MLLINARAANRRGGASVRVRKKYTFTSGNVHVTVMACPLYGIDTPPARTPAQTHGPRFYPGFLPPT